MENVPLKVIGSQLTATEFNDGPMTELKNAVTSTGQVLTVSDLNQLSKSMGNYASAATYFLDSGVANDYIVNTLSPLQGATQYFTGMTVNTLPLASSTGSAVTINVNSLGIKTVVTPYGGTPQADDIVANQPLSLLYDGSVFIITSKLSVPVGKATLSADQNIVDLAVTTLAFDTPIINLNSGFTPLDNSFNPKVSGIYSAGLSIGMINITGAVVRGQIMFNGVTPVGTFKDEVNLSGDTYVGYIEAKVAMNGTTDFLTFNVVHSDNSSRLAVAEVTFASINLIERT